VKPIDYGPLHGFLSQADAVGDPLVLVLFGVAFAIMALWKKGVLGEPSRDVLLALLMAVLGPVIFVTGSAHYILLAGTN
jgi:CBS-domain-containing membrane protein